MLGAHVSAAGTAFAVWAPNARGVRVIGDFNYWDPGAPDALAWRVRRVGDSHPGVGAGHQVQVRYLRAGRAWQRKADPMAQLTERSPDTASVVYRVRYQWDDHEWLAERAERACSPADERLRGAPRVVAARPFLRRACRPARQLRHRAWLHPRGVPAGCRASVRRVLGIPGHLVLRADVPVRLARRVPATWWTGCISQASAFLRLGARALPARRLGARQVRRHAAVRERRPAPRRAPGLGHADLRLRPPRGTQFPGGQRHLLAGGVPHRRPAGRRGRLHAVPGLLAAAGPVVAERARRPGEPGRRRRSSAR